MAPPAIPEQFLGLPGGRRERRTLRVGLYRIRYQARPALFHLLMLVSGWIGRRFDPIAAVLLGPIKRLVGPANQFIAILTRNERSNTHADRHR